MTEAELGLKRVIDLYVRQVRAGLFDQEYGDRILRISLREIDGDTVSRMFDQALRAAGGAGAQCDGGDPASTSVLAETLVAAEASESPAITGQKPPTQIDEPASLEPVLPTRASAPPSCADAFESDDDRPAAQIDEPVLPARCSCCRPGRLVDTSIVAEVLGLTEAAVREAVRRNARRVDGIDTARLWSGIVATRPSNSRNYKYWIPEGLLSTRR